MAHPLSQRTFFAFLLSLLVTSVAGFAAEGYRLPPQEIVDLIDAPLPPQLELGTHDGYGMLLHRAYLTSLEELAETELGLAGLRIKPDINGPSRLSPVKNLERFRRRDGAVSPIDSLPKNLRMVYWRWSPSGKYGSFGQMTPEGIELWMVDVEAAAARRLVGPRLSLTAQIAPTWIDDRSLLVTLVPENRGPAPRMSAIPAGPVVQETLGKAAAARTYQDLLASPHDEKLFDYYMTSQPAVVSLDGKVRPLGKAAIYWNIDPSPNGELLMVQSIHRPYSYSVPAFRFPKRTEVWNLDGKSIHTSYDRPLQESVPTMYGSVPVGPRQYSWRSDAPATLLWAEALDDGDAGNEAEYRDEIFLHSAPFQEKPRSLVRLNYRFAEAMWGHGELALVSSWWWQTRQVRAWHIKPDLPGEDPILVHERSWEDRYKDPGRPVMVTNDYGRPVLQISGDGRFLFFIGEGASPEGDRPFLDRWHTETQEITRLFQSEAPYYETPVKILDDRGELLLTRRESVDEVPNYYRRSPDFLLKLTDFPHPTPQLKGMQKEILRYRRKDGVELTGTLYTPAGYDAKRDGPLPTLVWAYPRELKSADAAGQLDDSPYRFNRVGWWSQILWLTQGYAILDDPKIPIIGEGDDEPNDTFREQLVGGAEAAVDELLRRGVSSPGQIAIGGHSYGAFMTANLLAHTDLFQAGIARSGAYNRTLTPFGFQSEQRTLWEAPEIYAAMSPFMHVDKINEPILLIHGESDNNPGTYPMQSDRLYAALKGHGAVARLVKLPLESHGYRARESILHMLWETHRWLETHLQTTRIESEVPETKAAPGG